jgi:TrmH family RNA methyltransferase
MIESLNSPHIARVKALIGSRESRRERTRVNLLQKVCNVHVKPLYAKSGPQVETVYLTVNGRSKAEEIADLSQFNTVDVSDEVMKRMSETVTPQGIIAICTIPDTQLDSIVLNGARKFHLFV